MPPMDSTSDISMNMPNQSMMYSTFTPIFGNLGFQIAPSQTGDVDYDFGQIPYFSLEGVLYMQQIASAVQPESVMPGQSQGQHNISGQYTVTGGAGNMQVSIGNATQASGSF